MPQPERVAILDPLSKHGGMHYYVHDQAVALAATGIDVTVFSPPTGLDPGGSYAQRFAFEGVFGLAPKPLRAARLVRDIISTIAAARRRRFDACVFHIFKSDGFEALAVGLAKAAGLRAYSVVHDVARLDAEAKFSLIRTIVRLSDGLIVHNEFSRDALVAAAPAAAAAKVRVIPHGNYVDRFPSPPAQAEARSALGLPADRLILLFFGNPRREKGLHVLLEALVPLAGREDLLLVVAGKMKPDDEVEVRAFVARHGLQSIVRLDIGHVADEAVPDYYRAASIVVLPYLRVYESGVALMAMSFGRPILASDLPVFARIVAEGGGGLLFGTGDAPALNARIARLLGGAEDCEALGRRAYRFAVEERGWARSGALLAGFIAEGDRRARR